MLGLRVHVFSLSLLYFFYSLSACGHPVLTCWQCWGLAERLFGLLVAPSFRQLCKEELGLCGYHWHVRGSEYRFYLFPPPTSFFPSGLFLFLSFAQPVGAIITTIHIEFSVLWKRWGRGIRGQDANSREVAVHQERNSAVCWREKKWSKQCGMQPERFSGLTLHCGVG